DPGDLAIGGQPDLRAGHDVDHGQGIGASRERRLRRRQGQRHHEQFVRRQRMARTGVRQQHAMVDQCAAGGAAGRGGGQRQHDQRLHAGADGAHHGQALPAPPPAGPSAGSSISNVTGTRTRPATGLPSSIAGSNFHRFTASSVTWSNTPAGSDFSTCTSATLPSAATSTISTTLPVVLLAAASAGYFGGASCFDRTSTCARASPSRPARESADAVAGRACDDAGALATLPASTATWVAGRAAQAAYAVPATTTVTRARPAATRRGPGIGRLSMTILSLMGWPPNQWQARGAGIADSWVFTIASPYRRRAWGWRATTLSSQASSWSRRKRSAAIQASGLNQYTQRRAASRALPSTSRRARWMRSWARIR